MLKLENVKVGTWVMDTSGLYEITNIDERVNAVYTLNEVIETESGEDEVSDIQRFLTKAEMKLMDIVG